MEFEWGDREEAGKPEEGGISFKDLKEILKEPAPPPAEGQGKVEEGTKADSSEALYRQALTELEKVVRALLEAQQPDLSPLVRITTDFVEALSASSRLLFFSLSYAETPFYPLLSAVNCAILAIKVGMGLGYEKRDLIKLGVASLLHDVGMWKVSRELVLKPGPLSPSERAEVNRRTVYSEELLKALPPDYQWLIGVALKTHERESGTASAQELKAEEIHDFAKIIGLVKSYEAMTRYRPYRIGGFRTPDDAITELLHIHQAEGYPEELIKTLVRQLSVYPPGSWVRLNSGQIARVLETNPLAPLRPKVEILFDPGLKRLKVPKGIDLDQDLLLYITGAILPTALPPEA